MPLRPAPRLRRVVGFAVAGAFERLRVPNFIRAVQFRPFGRNSLTTFRGQTALARPHGSVLRTLLRRYPGVSGPGLVGPTGYEPAIIQRRGRWIGPMKCPSVRAAKRLFGPRSRLRRPVGFGVVEPLRGCPHPSVLRTLAFRFATHALEVPNSMGLTTGALTRRAAGGADGR